MTPNGLEIVRATWNQFEIVLAGQNREHHKPPEVLKSQVFCFWSARGILTAQSTLTQRAWISTFIVDLRAEKIAAKFVMVGLPAEDNIR